MKKIYYFIFSMSEFVLKHLNAMKIFLFLNGLWQLIQSVNKILWSKQNEPSVTITMASFHSKKILLSILWGWNEILLYVLLPET